jgi:hypothetical protein
MDRPSRHRARRQSRSPRQPELRVLGWTNDVVIVLSVPVLAGDLFQDSGTVICLCFIERVGCGWGPDKPSASGGSDDGIVPG